RWSWSCWPHAPACRGNGDRGSEEPMRGMILLLALVSISMSAVAQILFKFGMSGGAVRAAIADGAPLGVLRAVALNPGVIGGLALYGLGTVLWLAVLSKAELSQAYPFVGLSFVLT